MSVTKCLVAVAALGLIGGAAHASTVIFTMYHDQNGLGAPAPGQFRVTAKVLGNDTGGLSGFGIDLQGGVTTLDHQSPRVRTLDPYHDGPAGFTLGRSADNVNFIVGSQDILNQDALMVYGFGKTAGAFPHTTIPEIWWDAEILLAVGTYAGAPPTFVESGPNTGANVFATSSGRVVKFPDAIVYQYNVPEPTALALLALAAAVVAAARFRA